MNHFKQFIRYLRKNFFPYGLTAGSNQQQQSHEDAVNGRGKACSNEPVQTICPQPIPEVSAKGKPAPKHIPAALEAALPPYPVIWAYFLVKKYPDTEAEAFYNRFQLVSWKSFGIKPIENWQQLADQWMMNVGSYNPPMQPGPGTPPFTDNENKHA